MAERYDRLAEFRGPGKLLQCSCTDFRLLNLLKLQNPVLDLIDWRSHSPAAAPPPPAAA